MMVATASTWQNGDSLDKGFSITATSDGAAEGLEHFIVRLVAPTGGATLAGQTVASVYVSDPGATPDVQFDVDSITTAERGFATAVAVVKRGSSAIGAVESSTMRSRAVTMRQPAVTFQGAASGTISWADGDADPKWIEFPIVDDGVGEGDEFFELTLTSPSGATLGAKSVLRVNIADGIRQHPGAERGRRREPDGQAGCNGDSRRRAVERPGRRCNYLRMGTDHGSLGHPERSRCRGDYLHRARR